MTCTERGHGGSFSRFRQARTLVTSHPMAVAIFESLHVWSESVLAFSQSYRVRRRLGLIAMAGPFGFARFAASGGCSGSKCLHRSGGTARLVWPVIPAKSQAYSENFAAR